MEEAAREVQGETVAKNVEPEIQLGFPAYIPDTCVQDENQRPVLYKRLAGFKAADDFVAIVDEMVGRFGEIPPLSSGVQLPEPMMTRRAQMH